MSNKYSPAVPFLGLRHFFDDEENWGLAPSSADVSVYEEDDHIVIEAALPGISSDQVQLVHEHGYVLIEGKKQAEEKKRKYYRKASQAFSYRVFIPAEADQTQQPEAIFKDGVIKILFSKSGGRRKTVPVKQG